MIASRLATPAPVLVVPVLVVAVLVVALLGLPAAPAHASRTIVAAPAGTATAAGTADAPMSLAAALAAARPGDTVLVRGGDHRGDVVVDAADATAAAPVTIQPWEGERPVLHGRLWLTSPTHWHIRGLEVSGWVGMDPHHHLVKITDGTDWSLRGMTIHHARSFAGLLVTGSDLRPTEPARWLVADSCIHDTVPSNDVNQDHLIYVNTGLGAGPGEIRGNVLHGAPNGNAVKLAGPRPELGGAVGVTVADNVIADVAQGVLVGGLSGDNHIIGNTFGPIAPPYRAIRSFRLVTTTNVAAGNTAHGTDGLFLAYDSPDGQVQDGGGNVVADGPGPEVSCALLGEPAAGGPVAQQATVPQGPTRYVRART